MAVDVAIVGGGFTGAVFAIYLSRMAGRPLDIAIVEPRARLGCGLAYDTADPDHRINAPLPLHVLYPEAPDHLPDWYTGQDGPARDPAALGPDGNLYIRRGDFGRYVEEQLRIHIEASASGSTIRHIRARAASAHRIAGGYRLTLDSGQTLATGLTVLAAGHERPRVPPPFDGAAQNSPGFIADPWDTARLREVPAEARVLVLGMSQTASDAVAILLRNGHRGPIASISRHGLRPRERPAAAAGPLPDIAQRLLRPVSLFVEAHGRLTTVRGLLRALRTAARRAEADGSAWAEPFGDLRDSIWDIWPALPLAEKRRFLRHLRAWYDAHRFQLPPQIEMRLAEAEAAGQLSFAAARCEAVACDGDTFSVALRRRGSSERRRERFDTVVNCTGPDLRPERSTNPFVAGLVARGYAAAHPLGIGFSVDDDCRAIGADGRADPHLRIVGPLTYGTFADQQGAPFIALRLHGIVPGIVAALRG